MLSDTIVLLNVLQSFEATLHLEYTENDVESILKAAQRRLENAYQCRLDEPVYRVQARSELVSSDLEAFLLRVLECVKQLSALTCFTLFSKRPPVLLSDVNYLGFTAESLTTVLKYLQDRIQYEKRAAYIPPIINALNKVEMSQIKRLFIIMLMLERLGISEGVAVCAQLLYIGGLVV